jgi:hypothetical protein
LADWVARGLALLVLELTAALQLAVGLEETLVPGVSRAIAFSNFNSFAVAWALPFLEVAIARRTFAAATLTIALIVAGVVGGETRIVGLAATARQTRVLIASIRRIAVG